MAGVKRVKSPSPWLLEVNLSPSLGADTPLDLKVKSCLLADLLTLVALAPHDRAAARAKERTLRAAAIERLSRGEPTHRRHKGASDAGRGRTPLRRALRTLDAEARRAGGFRRLFPLAGGGEYLLLFAQHRPLNAALVRELDARCARAAQAEDEAEEEAADAEDAAGGAQGRGGTAGAGPRGAGPGGVEVAKVEAALGGTEKAGAQLGAGGAGAVHGAAGGEAGGGEAGGSRAEQQPAPQPAVLEPTLPYPTVPEPTQPPHPARPRSAACAALGRGSP